jgi:hypothetical protein
MLFHIAWENVDTSDEGTRRNLEVFSKWQPPAGLEFKGFYGYADGSGGFAIVDADSAATIARATAPFLQWLRFSDPDCAHRRVNGDSERGARIPGLGGLKRQAALRHCPRVKAPRVSGWPRTQCGRSAETCPAA